MAKRLAGVASRRDILSLSFSLPIHGTAGLRPTRPSHSFHSHVRLTTFRSRRVVVSPMRPLGNGGRAPDTVRLGKGAAPSPLYSRQSQKKMTRKTCERRTTGEGRPKMWSSMAVRETLAAVAAAQTSSRSKPLYGSSLPLLTRSKAVLDLSL